MKLARVNLKQQLPSSGGFSTGCLRASDQMDLTYEAGIVRAVWTSGEGKREVMLVPMSNVLGMTPAEEKAAKK